jgi:hypothetical protein
LPIRERVASSLSELDAENGISEYHGAVRENWRLAEAQFRRTYFLWLLAAALFSLIHSHGISEFTLGPVKVTSLATVGRFLPVVMAALSYSVVVLATQIGVYEAVNLEVFKHRWPVAYTNNLEQPLCPPGSVVSPETATWHFYSREIAMALSKVLVVKNFVLVFAPLVGTLVSIAYLVADFRGVVAYAAAGVASLFALYTVALSAGFISFYRSANTND